MFGSGGMKKVFEEPPAISVQNNNITAEPYGHLGDQSSVHITRIDFDTGTRTDEIIDADVYEKRKRGETLPRRVHLQLNDSQADSLDNHPITTDSQRSQTPQYTPIPNPNTEIPTPSTPSD